MLFVAGIAYSRIRYRLSTFAYQREAHEKAQQAEMQRLMLAWTK